MSKSHHNLCLEEYKDGEEEENGLEDTTELVTRAEVEEEELEEDENGSGNFAEQPKVNFDEEHMDEDSVLFVATSPPVRILDEEEEEFEEDPIKEESLTDNIPDDTDDYNNNHEDVEAVLVITDDITSPSETEESGSGMLLESTPLLNWTILFYIYYERFEELTLFLIFCLQFLIFALYCSSVPLFEEEKN